MKKVGRLIVPQL